MGILISFSTKIRMKIIASLKLMILKFSKESISYEMELLLIKRFVFETHRLTRFPTGRSVKVIPIVWPLRSPNLTPSDFFL